MGSIEVWTMKYLQLNQLFKAAYSTPYIFCEVASRLSQSASSSSQLAKVTTERGKERGRRGGRLENQPLDLREILLCL